MVTLRNLASDFTAIVSPWSRLWSWDLIATLALLTFAALVALAYAIRVWRRGRAQFDRVDRQGGSALLSKEVMEGAYWFLQPVGRVLVSLGVSPNQVSWASFALALLTGAFLSVGHFGSAAVAGTLSALLDAVDGMVARLSGQASDAGEVLDVTVDRYAEFFFLGGLAIYYREMPTLLGLTLLALVGSFMVSYSTAKAEALQVDPPKGNMRRPERAVYLLAGAALSPVTIPLFETVRSTPVAVGHPMVFAVGMIAVLANVSAAERMTEIYRIMKSKRAVQLRALQAAKENALTESGDAPEAPSTQAARSPLRQDT